MKIQKVTPEELEEILDRDTMDEDLEEYEEYKIDMMDFDYMMTVGTPYYIEEYGLLIIEGIYYAEYDDGEMVPDWDASLIYEWDGREDFTEEDAQDWNYYEQGGFFSALHNYLHYKGDD